MHDSKRAKPGEEEKSAAASDDDDRNACPICFEIWTSQGAHQLCSLACGHFFGKSCIERILTELGKAARKCPICNRAAKVSEVRLHFVVSTFFCKDTAREEMLAQALNTERALRISAEMSDARNKARADALQLELAAKQTIATAAPQNSQNEPEGGSVAKSVRIQLTMHKSRACCWISRERGAVAAVYHDNKYKLCNIHPDFPGRSQTPSAGGSAPIPLPVRDIAYSNANSVSYGGCLALASLDKQIRLVSAQNLNEICTFKVDDPVWSVCFQSDRILLAGLGRGKFVWLDPRMPKEPVNVLQCAFSEPVQCIARISDTRAVLAGFTALAHVNRCAEVIALPGLAARAAGAQYASIASSGNEGELAVCVRGSSTNGDGGFLETGRVIASERAEPGAFEFSQSAHFALASPPSGRIACDSSRCLVPYSNTCALFSSSTWNAPETVRIRTNTGITNAWLCQDASDELDGMITGQNVVEFFKL